jgi:N-glycosylase/DNA lyase
MDKLLAGIQGLKGSNLRQKIDSRIREFEAAGKQGSKSLFSELCFCLLTANFNAERAIKIQQAIGNGFSLLPQKQLAARLKELGHRYPNARAAYIVEARRHKGALKSKISSFKNECDAREWLVENVKGLGFKEASHFLRNIGFKHLAIIDFHIVDLLAKHGLLEKPKSKSLSKKLYLEIESLLKKIAESSGLNLAELDLYLWYQETGKILK